jgi:DAK2 domain fusion protein YloV
MAAADWVDADRDELNRINVFPVPDGDTGTNFGLTLRAVADSVAELTRPTLPAVTKAMADSSVLSAHGNSGLLLSQFLLGFRERLGNRHAALPAHVADGMGGGADRVSAALDTPVEGTILTICRDVAEAARDMSPHVNDFVSFMDRILASARASLARTPDLLPVLREAGVVDAGAKGFVLLFEGIVKLIRGETLERPPQAPSPAPRVAAEAEVSPDRDYRYCTEMLVRGGGFPPGNAIRAHLRELGGSIVVLATEDLLKVHIHTDDPARVYTLGANWGAVESTKADDMREQHRALQHAHAGTIGIVVDSAGDLSDDLADQAGIAVVPIQVMDGTRTYRDRIDIRGEEIYARMRQGGATFSTSQPPPGAFLRAFQDAGAHAADILCITVASQLSGTFRAAQTAADNLGGKTRVTVFDSRTVSLGQGMLALRAQELADEGLAINDIVAELDRVRDRSGVLISFDTLDNLVRSGRIGRGRAWLGNLLDVKPIFEIDVTGKVQPVDRVRGRDAVAPRILEHLERRLRPRPARLRIGLVHADALEAVRRLREEIESRFQPYECLVDHVTAAIGIHAGPGAWGVFYQVESSERFESGERE